MNRILMLFVLTGLIALTAAAQATSVMVVNRGLPTANLNNAAGALRSNIEWADDEITNDPATFYLPGDDFKITGSGAYRVNKIRVWSTDKTGLSLQGGLAGGPKGMQSIVYTATPVTYVNGQGYQGSSGTYSQIYRIDFNVNIALSGGQTYQFYLNGPIVPDGSSYRNAYLHGSNAALSGSPQQGSDDTWHWLDPQRVDQTWFSGTGGGTLCSPGLCPGWDKNSDANVQVFVTINKDQCKNGGWTSLFRTNGTPFENQGDCIEYVNNHKDDDDKDKQDNDGKDGHDH